MRVSHALEAGVAVATLTPPPGVDLAGYAARHGPSTGVHDDLYAKALVLRQGTMRLALVTTDLIGLGATMGCDIRRRIQEQTGIPVARIVITSSHTHSGPVTDVFPIGIGMGTPEAAYLKAIERRIARAVVHAAARVQPATIGCALGKARININRRGKTQPGTLALSPNRDGIVDEDVGVIRIETRRGRVLAHVVNYACHGVVLGHKNQRVSADYPGAVQQTMEALGGIVLFTNGAGGNLNPIVQAGSFADVKRAGRMVAKAAIEASRTAKLCLNPTLSIINRRIALPCRQRFRKSDLQAIVTREERRLKTSSPESAPEGEREVSAMWIAWARDTLARQHGRTLPKRVILPVQTLTIGPLALVAIPAEVFVETGLRIKHDSPYPFTHVLGYAAGIVGYLPTRQAMREGGYETWAHIVYGGSPLLPGAEAVLRKGIRRMLHRGPRAGH